MNKRRAHPRPNSGFVPQMAAQLALTKLRHEKMNVIPLIGHIVDLLSGNDAGRRLDSDQVCRDRETSSDQTPQKDG